MLGEHLRTQRTKRRGLRAQMLAKIRLLATDQHKWCTQQPQHWPRQVDVEPTYSS